MKIQIITNRQINELNWKHGNITSLNQPKSLDENDVNIIDLSHVYLWKNSSDTKLSIENEADLKSISKMILGSKKAVNIIVYPQNVTYNYNSYISTNIARYRYNCQLKDMLIELTRYIMPKVFPYDNTIISLQYENTTTTLNRIKFNAAFHFSNITQDKYILSSSDSSEKITTVLLNDRLIATTLDIFDNVENIIEFLKEIGVYKDKTDIPEWLNDYDYFDDKEQKSLIKISNEIIDNETGKIELAEKKIYENMRYKSVLYTNGDELVEVVFEILEKILNCDLSDFEDEKKEDFLIKADNITFIGEIKGVTSNVKSEHVSQVDVHYHAYIDKLQEKGTTENVKEILIVNPFRTREPSIRDEVHEIQINLAKRNGCLIITTEILLFIFEKFINNELGVEQILKFFTDNTGNLTKENLSF